ncbi:hypothetical protein BKA70DRAFT_1310448 [Coprinopsis sp. MPI-PUGE-AT-0042]|nr:hypothetical protein BKA70DRAFT_1310448 [Coprinopsis sp. MPI-PUGE-AT-0042]
MPSDADAQNSLAGKTPPEIWAIVFRLIFELELFGPDERQEYNCLRSVCATWRRVLATTPGLCPGLSIDWGQLASNFDIEVFKARYAPWLALIRENHPFYLVLGESWGALNDEDSTSLLQYLLCEATTTPTNLHIQAGKLFEGMLSMPGTCNSVIHLSLDHPYEDLDDYNLARLPVVSPRLESFNANARHTFYNPFIYPNLQSLTLLDILATPGEVANLCAKLPCLRELKISYEDHIEELMSRHDPDSPFTHSTLETLLIVGEYLLPFMGHLTLPSLKFFGVEVWGMEDGAPIWEANLPAFFQRSHLDNLPFSLQGRCWENFFPAVTRSLPPATILLLNPLVIADDRYGDEEQVKQPPTDPERFEVGNIKQMICFDRMFLYEYTSRSLSNHTTPVLFPEGTLVEEEVEPLKKELREKGFILEQCSPWIVEDILGSPISPMIVEWMS